MQQFKKDEYVRVRIGCVWYFGQIINYVFGIERYEIDYDTKANFKQGIMNIWAHFDKCDIKPMNEADKALFLSAYLPT